MNGYTLPINVTNAFFGGNSFTSESFTASVNPFTGQFTIPPLANSLGIKVSGIFQPPTEVSEDVSSSPSPPSTKPYIWRYK